MSDVLVDTNIWSLALRRKERIKSKNLDRFIDLLMRGEVAIIGSIRQEILSGIKDKKQFEDVKSYLSAFKDISIKTEDFERAAELNNECRRNGIQGSNTDFLICAVSIRNEVPIFTSDKDFLNYSKIIDIRLY